MKNKKIIYRIIKLITFLLILFICLAIASNILKIKYPYEKMDDFFSQKEDFNVLFMGSSHVLNGVYPMELWKNYGIVSYNLANGGEKVVITYHNLQLALKYTKPDLVVIDAYTALEEGRFHEGNNNYTHNILDAYPLSYTKYLAVKDIFAEDYSIDRMAEYLFDFSIYHARWDELDVGDFDVNRKLEKGSEFVSNIKAPKEFYDYDFESIPAYNGPGTVNTEYFRKTIEYLKENNIEVLVTMLPFSASENDAGISKYIQSICDEYSVNYINFLPMDIVDYNTDFFDENSHLNPSGSRKVTNYIGKYISQNYNIPDQRNNEKYSFWNDDYNEYIYQKISNLEQNEQNLENYLMLLYNEDDIGYEIQIADESKIVPGSLLERVLKNLENTYTIDKEAFEENKDKNIKITTWDKRNSNLIHTLWF